MKYKAVISFLALFISSAASSEVIVNLDRDLQLLAVNGEKLSGNFGHTKQIVLDNGINQLLVRAEKVIHIGGNQNKYKSPTMVIKLVADDAEVLIKPAINIRDETMARSFDRNPSLSLMTQSEDVTYAQDVLVSGGMGFLRNYEKELVRFNQSQSPAALTQLIDKHQFKLNEDSTAGQELTKVQQLQAHFVELQLSHEEKKAFLSWAIHQ